MPVPQRTSGRRCACGSTEVRYPGTSECARCYKRRYRADPAGAARERETSRAWKDRNREADRARNRAYRKAKVREGKNPCDCGRAFIDPGIEHCGICANEMHAQALYSEIHRMWRDGATIDQIADAIGKSKGYVAGTISRMRAMGWDLPYRYRRSVPC